MLMDSALVCLEVAVSSAWSQAAAVATAAVTMGAAGVGIVATGAVRLPMSNLAKESVHIADARRLGPHDVGSSQ